jgi:hypothetical protein
MTSINPADAAHYRTSSMADFSNAKLKHVQDK